MEASNVSLGKHTLTDEASEKAKEIHEACYRYPTSAFNRFKMALGYFHAMGFAPTQSKNGSIEPNNPAIHEEIAFIRAVSDKVGLCGIYLGMSVYVFIDYSTGDVKGVFYLGEDDCGEFGYQIHTEDDNLPNTLISLLDMFVRPENRSFTFIYFYMNDNHRLDVVPVERTPPENKIDTHLLYPRLPSPNQLWREFQQSPETVILLKGMRGTGKTRYIWEMIKERNRKKNIVLVDNVDVIRDGALFPRLLKMSTETDEEEGELLVIVEDADILLSRREDGNQTMASLLSITDGFLTHNIKFVITTNLENEKQIDSALLRSGRTFGVYDFKELSHEEVVNLRNATGRTQAVPERDMSLAEALNHKGEKTHEEKENESRIGFI